VRAGERDTAVFSLDFYRFLSSDGFKEIGSSLQAVGFSKRFIAPCVGTAQSTPSPELFFRDGQSGTASGATAFDNSPPRLGRHPLAETVVVFSFSIRWLKGSLHSILILNKTAIYNYLEYRQGKRRVRFANRCLPVQKVIFTV